MFDHKKFHNYDVIEDESKLMINQSTTVGNSTVQQIHHLDNSSLQNNTTFFMGINAVNTHINYSYCVPPALKRTHSNDRKKDFHKKLQGKLDTLIKKKDCELLM